MKVKEMREKGITLIALVVTIIILLILAGITLNMALSGDGLFSRAKNAADKYKKAQEDETKLISEIGKEMYSEYVGAYVTGYNPVAKTDDAPFEIETTTSGAEVKQKFTTENIKWRIWDYDGTVLRLISDRPTTQILKLSGVNGYNNGVWAINEICRQCYTMEGVEGITVRNLRRSDIEAVSNYDYTKYKHELSTFEESIGEEEGKTYIYYGGTKKYSATQCPAMWKEYDFNWNYKYDTGTITGNSSCENPWEQEFNTEATGFTDVPEQTEFKESYYYHTYTNKEKEFKNSIYFDLLFGNSRDVVFDKRYWLAGRYVTLRENGCGFGIHCATGTGAAVVSGNAVVGHNRYT